MRDLRFRRRVPTRKRDLVDKVIYPTPVPKDRPYMIGGGGCFIPVYDSTDHFHWACHRCRVVAHVLMVKRGDFYAHTPTIYFYLRCPKCGAEGQRKIYLEDEDPRYLDFPTETEPLWKQG